MSVIYFNLRSGARVFKKNIKMLPLPHHTPVLPSILSNSHTPAGGSAPRVLPDALSHTHALQRRTSTRSTPGCAFPPVLTVSCSAEGGVTAPATHSHSHTHPHARCSLSPSSRRRVGAAPQPEPPGKTPSPLFSKPTRLCGPLTRCWRRLVCWISTRAAGKLCCFKCLVADLPSLSLPNAAVCNYA